MDDELRWKLEELFDRVTYPFKRTYWFLDRLITIIPTLWKDQDWDYEGIYYYLEFKLKRLREVLVEDDIHKDSPRCVKQIDIVLEHLNRHLKWDDYLVWPMDGPIFGKPETVESYHQKHHIIKFEEKNRKLFWKQLVHWYRNWWS